jgi:hypothetical protein
VSRRRADQQRGLGSLRFEDARLLLRANAVGPIMVTQQYLDSEYGSVSENTEAALNMLMRSLTADARRLGVITALLDPGWVSTDMGGPQAPVTPRDRWPG